MRKAFTLIELIVVITIVGVLSAIALAKFFDADDNSEISQDIRVSISIGLSIHARNLIPSVYLNLVDLEGRYTSDRVTLTDLITLDGKNWSVSADGNKILYNDIHLDSNDTTLITLELHPNRTITLKIDCDKYENLLYYTKCKLLAPNKISTLSF